MDHAEALECGLINYFIEEPDQLLVKTREILGVIISKAPIAIARIIECANIAGSPDGYQHEMSAFGECFATEDMKEGAAAFLEKRKPRFTGK
jgi:enoyl-CoA hydratase